MSFFVVDTPVDKIGFLVNLKWYSTMLYKDKDKDTNYYQVPDPSEEELVKFLCSTCNHDFNPCYYKNTHLPHNTCQCSGGARGTLCQKSAMAFVTLSK